MLKRLFTLFIFVALILSLAPSDKTIAAEENTSKTLSVEEIIEKIKENQEKIKDMSADVETKITSTLKDSKEIIQKGQILTKPPDKSRVEIFSPMRQITITNGDTMTIISPDTGMKFTQDLSKEKSAMSKLSSPSDTTKIFDYFDLKLTDHGTKEYIISGSPKEENEFLGKIDFFVDRERIIPLRIVIYNPEGVLISLSELEYKKISDIWIPIKTASIVSVPGGSMNVDMEFKNIKINKGISDDKFKAE